MKVSTIILAVGAFAASVIAQGLNDFPTCSQSCLLSAVQASGCGLTDFKCSCSSKAFVDSAVPCIDGACSPEDITKARAAAVALCKANGVDLVLPGEPEPEPEPEPTNPPQPEPTNPGPPGCKPKRFKPRRNVRL